MSATRLLYPKVVPALGEAELCVTEGDQFLGDVSHIPRREELDLFLR
jgi:hypothetical protein